MNRPARHIPPAAGALLCVLAGCSSTPLSGPPELRLGRDECAECGMIINEDRCSSALLIERDGFRDHAVFDDIGCMLDYQHDHPEITVKQQFVHDYKTGQWRTASESTFACDTTYSTPMASGIVAFSPAPAGSPGAAAKTLTLSEITALRIERNRARRGQ